MLGLCWHPRYVQACCKGRQWQEFYLECTFYPLWTQFDCSRLSPRSSWHPNWCQRPLQEFQKQGPDIVSRFEYQRVSVPSPSFQGDRGSSSWSKAVPMPLVQKTAPSHKCVTSCQSVRRESLRRLNIMQSSNRCAQVACWSDKPELVERQSPGSAKRKPWCNSWESSWWSLICADSPGTERDLEAGRPSSATWHSSCQST